MAKSYFLAFGSGDPRGNTGLAPTFLIFANYGGSNATAPAISEVGTSTGIYKFTYGPTNAITFLVDGGAALSTADRYIKDALDPVQAVDEKIGTINDSFGSTSVDPSTLLGYAKRNQEWLEGDAVFTKATGLWDVSSRGSSTLLKEKTLTNTSSTATKA